MNDIGVLFDMDGVIVDNHRYHFQAWLILGEKYGKSFDENTYKEQLNGRTLTEVVQYIFGDDGIDTEGIRAIGEEKEALYRKLYRPHLAMTPGLADFMADCERLDVPMVVGTSAPPVNVDFTLDGLGIRSKFRAILDERAVTKGKPHPEIYEKCAKAIGLANQQCVVFEDAVSGIKAGQSAGSKVIALATSHDRSELSADLVIDDFIGMNLEKVRILLQDK
ncbi:MAG: HAD family phosphatase [Bacteroidota bacterium]